MLLFSTLLESPISSLFPHNKPPSDCVTKGSPLHFLTTFQLNFSRVIFSLKHIRFANTDRHNCLRWWWTWKVWIRKQIFIIGYYKNFTSISSCWEGLTSKFQPSQFSIQTSSLKQLQIWRLQINMKQIYIIYITNVFCNRFHVVSVIFKISNIIRDTHPYLKSNLYLEWFSQSHPFLLWVMTRIISEYDPSVFIPTAIYHRSIF